MYVTVTQEHIDKGTPQDSDSCAIALSLRELTHELWEVEADSAFSWTEGYRLPKSAQRFIERYDGGKPVTPFRFRMTKRAF